MSSSSNPKEEVFGRDIPGLLLAAEAGQEADIMTCSSGHQRPCKLNQSQPLKEVTKSFFRASQSQEDLQNTLTCKQKQTKPVTNVKKQGVEEYPPACPDLVQSKVSASTEDFVKRFPSDANKREEGISLTEIFCLPSNSLPVQQTNFCNEISSPDPEGELKMCSSHLDKKGQKKECQLKINPLLKSQVIVKQDPWAARNIAEMHEKKLKRELQKLSVQSLPSRDRLTVFSDVFDDVCEGSPVFGRILREIKMEYDLFVNHLMASQTCNTFLVGSVKDLGSSKVRETELEDAEKEVCALEKEVREALEKEKRVKEELHKVLEIKNPEDSCNANLSLSELGLSLTAINCTDSVQSKRLQVLNIWKEIQQLEEEIKDKLVPAATTMAIEKHTKDIKTEIMTLIASNHCLKAANKDLENNINMVLDTEKASKATRRMLWEDIHSDPQTQ